MCGKPLRVVSLFATTDEASTAGAQKVEHALKVEHVAFSRAATLPHGQRERETVCCPSVGSRP